ncbi:MAG: hypothetical protein KAJ19_27780, partial [Gammaproteobacteria bacterium]|nr:hypothetical protein [Gammaproteobacteria bacterium]
MAVSGGATGLIMALNSAKTVKSTTNLKKSVDGLNKAQESGALPNVRDIFQNMVSIGPAANALAVFSAKLQSETAESSVRLLKELLELLGSDIGQAGINALAGLINNITEKAETIAKLLNLFSDTDLEKPLEVITTIAGVITTLVNPIELISESLTIFTAGIEFLKDTTSDFETKLDTFLESAGLVGDFIQWITGLIEKLIGTKTEAEQTQNGTWIITEWGELIFIPATSAPPTPSVDYDAYAGGG